MTYWTQSSDLRSTSTRQVNDVFTTSLRRIRAAIVPGSNTSGLLVPGRYTKSKHSNNDFIDRSSGAVARLFLERSSVSRPPSPQKAPDCNIVYDTPLNIIIYGIKTDW